MDLKKLVIKCPFHPKENLKKVDLEFGCPRDLLCAECIISDESYLSNPKIKTLEEFVNIGAKYYVDNFKRGQSDVDVPEDIKDFIQRQSDYIETISQHVEQEQKRLQVKFDELTKEIFKIITEKKEEFIKELDKQVLYARSNYLFFEKQVRKAYPRLDDVGLYPTKEELLNSMSKFVFPSHLQQFVRNIKEDMNENKVYDIDETSNVTEEIRRKFLVDLSERVEKNLKNIPKLVFTDSEVIKAKEDLRANIDLSLSAVFKIEHNLDVFSGGDTSKSTIVSSAELNMIRKWLDGEFKNMKLKLIYKGTKDGLTATSFHQICDNKGPTISLMKSKQGKIFGGFMPEAWKSKGSYVNTTKAWLFSVTLKSKYTLTSDSSHAQYGGYDSASYGPTWGGGHDLYLAADFTSSSNYCNRYSYNFTDNTSFTGGYNFNIEEIEVYSVTK